MNIAAITLVLTTLLMAGCLSPTTQANALQPAAASESVTRLTKEQAEAIALKAAGFTADQVSRLRTEYEIDDGIPRFEVQFRQGHWKYDYEIHAQTGEILSYDRDS